MPIPKKYLPLLVAGVLGLLSLFLFNIYLKQQTEQVRIKEMEKQKNVATVLVAKQDIPAGTAITEGMLKEETVRRDTLQPRAASDIDRVINKVTVAPISRGEQILLNKLTLSGFETSLASKVPRGKRAITVPVDNISSVGGMIRPGDHVDVIGMVPVPAMTPDGKQTQQINNVPLFQDVLILAVGQEFTSVPVAGEKKSEKTLSPVITLALNPQEASLIAFIQEQGKIRLILRSPEDTQVHPASSVRAGWDTVLKTIMPEAFQDQGAPKDKEPVKARNQVEIYRGLQKEVKGLE